MAMSGLVSLNCAPRHYAIARIFSAPVGSVCVVHTAAGHYFEFWAVDADRAELAARRAAQDLPIFFLTMTREGRGDSLPQAFSRPRLAHYLLLHAPASHAVGYVECLGDDCLGILDTSAGHHFEFLAVGPVQAELEAYRAAMKLRLEIVKWGR